MSEAQPRIKSQDRETGKIWQSISSGGAHWDPRFTTRCGTVTVWPVTILRPLLNADSSQRTFFFSYPPLSFYISQLASGFGGPFLIKNGKSKEWKRHGPESVNGKISLTKYAFPGMKHVSREVRLKMGLVRFTSLCWLPVRRMLTQCRLQKPFNSREASGSENVGMDPSAVSQTKRSPTVAPNASSLETAELAFSQSIVF